MRSNTAALDTFLRRLLASHVVDDAAAPTNFSVRIEQAAPGVSPLHTLFSGSGRIIFKDRSASRIVHALLAQLSGFADAAPPDGMLALDATVVVRDGKAVVAAPLQPGVRAFDATLRRAGMQRADHPVVHLDLADMSLVVPEPALDADVTAWASPPGELADLQLEPTDPSVGRYELRGVALVDVEDAPEPRSRAAVVSAVASLVRRPAAVDGPVLLSAARRVAERVPVATLFTWKPSKKEAEQIKDLLG